MTNLTEFHGKVYGQLRFGMLVCTLLNPLMVSSLVMKAECLLS